MIFDTYFRISIQQKRKENKEGEKMYEIGVGRLSLESRGMNLFQKQIVALGVKYTRTDTE